MCEYLGRQEGIVFREGPVVEDQQELHASFKSLNGMGHATDWSAYSLVIEGDLRREEPDIALGYVVDEGLAVFVYSLRSSVNNQRAR